MIYAHLPYDPQDYGIDSFFFERFVE